LEYLTSRCSPLRRKLLKTYRRTKDWPAYEADFLAVMKERRVPQVSTPSRVPKVLFSAPNPARRNAIAASSPIFSPATGASKATPSKFAISFRRAKNLQSPGANQWVLLMTKLLITEINAQGPAFCVIGLQRENEKIHSIRPVPSSQTAGCTFLISAVTFLTFL